MADILSFNPVRVLDGNGVPVPGALAYTYSSGSLIPAQTYTDATLTTLNPWPLAADGDGIFPPMFVADGFATKVVVTDALGATLPGYPIDPIVRGSTETRGASQIYFVPTSDIPNTNVQDAIERVQANISSNFQQYGLGISGDMPLASNIDLTNIKTGQYRYDGTTTGTFPSGVTKADGGAIELIRQTSSEAVMVLWPEASTVPWLRVMSSLVWGGWTRKTVVDSGTAAAPSVTTTNDLDTGIYFPSAGQAAFAIDGVQRLLGTATYWQSSNPVYLPLGSAAAPSQAFTGDTNTGVYSTGADKWAVAVAGARFFELGGGDAYIAGRMTGYPVSQFPAFGSYGGTANAITVNTGGNSQDIGTTIAFKATAANTGATTINANGLGATACVTPTYAALPAGYIRTDVITIATLTGSGWMVGRLPEYGSGTNGEWWRYEDGRQECISAITTSASAEASVTFEKAFSSVPRVTLGVNSSATFAISPRFTGLTTSGLSVSAYNTSNARIAAQVEYHAVGKWF